MTSRSQSGIALLEALVALSLLSMSFAMLMQSQTTALRLTSKADLAIRKSQARESAFASYRAQELINTRHVFNVENSSLLGVLQCAYLQPDLSLLNCQYSFSDMPEQHDVFIN